MIIHNYIVEASVSSSKRIALIADLHDRDAELMLMSLRAMRPNIIAIAGDLTNNKTEMKDNTANLLAKLSEIAPVFYSLGNHEYDFNEDDVKRVRSSGAKLLIDEFCTYEDLCIGGLRSRTKYRPFPEGRSTTAPYCGWLDEFEKQKGYKILINHHPEYYEAFLKNRSIDLILSGHAHGGQIRLFGRGLFSPGQGIFPRYTKGMHDGRLIISAGLANTVRKIPRLFNPTELVYINLEKKPQT